MSKKVGSLSEYASKDTGEIGYLGEIDIAEITGKVALKPVENKRSERSPDYDLLVQVRGFWKPYGKVWRKEPKMGGEEFLSITVDHETMNQPVYCAAFPPSEDEDEGLWNIVWGRTRGGQSVASAEAETSDSIPF